jgi:hypothetical protein
MVKFFSLSIIPDIINNIPKNPKTAGMMCENISVPVAILSHYSIDLYYKSFIFIIIKSFLTFNFLIFF